MIYTIAGCFLMIVAIGCAMLADFESLFLIGIPIGFLGGTFCFIKAARSACIEGKEAALKRLKRERPEIWHNHPELKKMFFN